MTRRPAGPALPLVPSSPASPRPRSTAVVAVVLVGLLVGLLAAPVALAILASPAAAHDAMIGSTPADGSTVETPPTSLDLAFGRPPLAIGAEVRVTGPDGTVVNDGDLVLTGTVVSQPLAAELPAGGYAVAWRVTSSDGHPISGELTFTAASGTVPAEAAAGPTAEPGAEPTGESTAEPTAEPTAGVDPPELNAGSDVAEPGATEGSTGPLPWVLGAIGVLVAAAAVWWAARRRSGAGARG